MTFGSLFAGIGGLDLGLERAGMTCAWQVEIDPYCRRVLTKHWPDVPKFEDVRDVGAHNLPAVDLICGGFPCQDISNAGKRAGIDGERSGLWSEYARIIGELRPRYVLVENSAALLGRGLFRVLGDLAESGYDAEWDCVPASAVGAPHRRDRTFIVAYSVRVGPTTNTPSQEREKSVFDRQRNGTRAAAGWAQLEPWVARNTHWQTEPAVGRVADGVPAWVDRLTALGNAVVPQVAEYLGRLIMQHARALLVERPTQPMEASD